MTDEDRNIAVIGAGEIGSVIARMLADQGHCVTLADNDQQRLQKEASPGIGIAPVDARDARDLRVFLSDKDIVVSACPWFLNRGIAEAAAAAGTHYFDLTEDVATTDHIRGLARDAGVAFMPQCGLAPGFICVLGADMAARFEKTRSVRLRVGALPRYPANALRYNLTWSVDGLINEYSNACEMISDGRKQLVPALEGLETVLIEGVEYEAFYTSGGLGTLAESLAGRLDELSYRSLRYPGHAAIMKLLLQDFGLAEDRPTMARILERAAPLAVEDAVIIFVTGVGEREGRMVEESVVLRYEADAGMRAIQRTTAAGCVAMIELFLTGRLPQTGFLRQEDAPLSAFLGTEAGALLANTK